MSQRLRPPPPLDRDSLDRLALRYVERFATTRARLAEYLSRKIRERGWDGPPADPPAVAERLARLGYVDDQAFAAARARSMARRGLGQRRIAAAFRAAGITESDAEAVAPDIADGAVDAALALARRKRIGPYAAAVADPSGRERQLAQMIRGGHGFALSRRIVNMTPGDDVGELYDVG
jgi:regulatory protein